MCTSTCTSPSPSPSPSRHVSVSLLSLLLCFTITLTCVNATEYFSGDEYDPTVTLSFSSPMTVPESVSSESALNTVPTSILFYLARFGGNVISPNNRSSETVEVVLAIPLDACEDLRHPTIVNATQEQIKQYYQGKIVITERGTCYVYEKAERVERVGALLHLMTLQSSDPDRRGGGSFAGASETDPLLMPTGIVDFSPGYTLTRTMLANPDVTVTGTIATTGPADPRDTAALVRLFRQIDVTYPGGVEQLAIDWFWYDAEYGAQSVYNPIIFLNDSTVLDPCLNRIWHIYCTGGRISYIDFGSYGLELEDEFDSFSPFQGLVYLSASYNNLKGPMPCAWGSMSQLKAVSLGMTGLTSWTECCAGMTSLEYVLAGFNEITNLPKCLEQLHNMQVISFDTAKISAPMINISNWTKLWFFDLNANNITGSLPNLQFARNTLKTFVMTDNHLTGQLPSDMFDNMPKLQSVDLGRNELSGPLPSFNNSHRLVDLGLDHNNFVGEIPSTWKFPHLLSLRAGHNALTGSLFPLSTFTSLISVDMSWNDLYVPPVDETDPETYDWYDVMYYLSDCLPMSIETIQLSNNRINGTWRGEFKQTNIAQIYLSHNLLTAIDSGQTFLFVSGLVSKVSVLDLSYNPLLTGSLAKVGPTTVLQVLKLNGCPLLRDIYNDPPALPQYIMTSEDQITKNSADERYSCPGLTGRYYPLQVALDPSYYGYTGCVCDQGTYGNPPDCLIIPIKSNTTADPITASVAFTDEVYGSSRMSIGIDTAWAIGYIGMLEKNVTTMKNVIVPVMNGTSNSSSMVNTTQQVNKTELVQIGGAIDRTVAIYITINLLPMFNEYADIIDIYAGETVQTTPIVSIRGNYPRPIPSNYPDIIKSAGYTSKDNDTVTFVVFASHATVNFRSRETQGKHFTANATLSSKCPSGWYFDESITKQCQLIPAILPIYEISSAVATVVWVVAAISFAIIFSTFVFVAYFRTTVIFKAASVPFCLTMLFAAALMTAGSVFYPLSPERGDYVCDARVWFSTLSLVTLLACLLTKANRIRDIFTNNDLNKPVQTNKHLIRTVALIIAAEVILLIALTSSNMTHPQLSLGSKATEGHQVYSCTSVEGDSFKAWLALQLTFIGVFLFSGTYIAFGIRNVPSAFNESSSIVNALYILALLSIILLPVNFIVDDNVNALALIRGVGQCLVAFSMTLALFGPKFYYILDGRGNDASMIQTTLGQSQKRSRTGSEAAPASKLAQGSSGEKANNNNNNHNNNNRDELFKRFLKLESQLKQLEETVKNGGSIEDVQRVMARKTTAPSITSASNITSKDKQMQARDSVMMMSKSSGEGIAMSAIVRPVGSFIQSDAGTSEGVCHAARASIVPSSIASPSSPSLSTAPMMQGREYRQRVMTDSQWGLASTSTSNLATTTIDDSDVNITMHTAAGTSKNYI